VSVYAKGNQLPDDQLASVISAVYDALIRLDKPSEESTDARSPAVPIRRSVQRDHVVCLECGWRGKMLRRHIGARHGLSVNAYRARWELSAQHPLTAPAYSEKRSAFAKEVGLGRQRRENDLVPVSLSENAGASVDAEIPGAG
jgi:MucR family transcriptional regulator, transcriptional regulator of exopolysaccharide biosynthesis